MTALLTIIIFAVLALGAILTAAIASVYVQLRNLGAQQTQNDLRFVAAETRIEALNRNDFTLLRKVKTMATKQDLLNAVGNLKTDVPALIAERDALKQQNTDLSNQNANLQQQLTDANAALATAQASAASAADTVDDSIVADLTSLDQQIKPAAQ
jgi:chromosome segregation ATPase